jgi:hypothetical protein
MERLDETLEKDCHLAKAAVAAMHIHSRNVSRGSTMLELMRFAVEGKRMNCCWMNGQGCGARAKHVIARFSNVASSSHPFTHAGPPQPAMHAQLHSMMINAVRHCEH